MKKMHCPYCKEGEVKIKKKLIEEKIYLIQTCNKCDYCAKIYLH